MYFTLRVRHTFICVSIDTEMYNIDVFTGLKWKLFSYYQLFNIKGLVHPNIIFVS